MSVSTTDWLPMRSCKHMSGRQLLLWLIVYSLVFCLIVLTFLNHKFPGYFASNKPAGPVQNPAQLILRRVPTDQQDEEARLHSNFIFMGNALAHSTETERAGGKAKHEAAEQKSLPSDKRKGVKIKELLPHGDKLGENEKGERTGGSVAAENAIIQNEQNEGGADFRQRPLTVQYYHGVIDNEPFNHRYNTCAIVSSSGQLLGKNAGPEIDSADCVIRMNAAPIKGFERDVGNRTTIRVACFISSQQLTSQADDILTGSGAPEMVLFWGLEAPRSKRKAQAVPKVTSLQKRFMHIRFYSHRDEGELAANRLFERETGASRMDTNSWLSTGWFTLMAALDICGAVRIYGMVPDDHCVHHERERVKYHYYQPKSEPTECTYYKVHEATPKGGHRFMTEKAIFARWAQYYNLTFHHPNWNRSLNESAKKLDTPFAKIFHVKGLNYFQRSGYARKGETEETLPVVVCVAVVLGIPGLFICIGACMACFSEEDDNQIRYRPRHHRRFQHHFH